MARKTKESRLQYGLFATPLEEMIAPDNPVRVVDAFVDAMDLASFGFKAVAPSHMGAASYDPSDLLKIYFYGYFNRVRSSRCLERECARNVEMMWLTGRLTPCYHTISTFRTYKEEDKDGKVLHDHRRALVAVFRSFNRFLDRQGLFGKETFAVDGTKMAAQNSKKKHISEDKIARKLQRLDGRIAEYLEELEAADREAAPTEKKGAVQKAIQELEANKEAVLQLGDMLQAAQNEDPTVTQVSLTDPDARMLPINNEGMMMVAYNVQSTVDAQHCLIADFSVENQKDNYLLAPMGASVKEALSIEGDIDLLADKGYHSGKGLQACAEGGITTYVAFPEQAYGDRPKGFQKPDFKYDEGKDVYLCPAKKELATSGTWHGKLGRQKHPQGRYKLYRSPFTVCSACPFRDKCLS
ncbi:MAG: IS1182 family transposase, partial [Saprospiraceae bacterium]|nr:IS1182 family transposase [Saprospiraceae bacterium]MCF8314467.1 IS1182 family transposase [Saprospiraceae bacterium]